LPHQCFTAAKYKELILVKLNTHLLSGVHTRRSQLQRAFKITQKNKEGDQVKCPLCDRSYKAVSKFIAHVESDHHEQLYEKPEVSSGGGDVEDDGGFLEE
jgi:uncharacterized C2H2 Zn-finger protein